MRKLQLFFTILTLSLNSFAAECPDLSGLYEGCYSWTGGKEINNLQVTMRQDSNQVTIYQFTYSDKDGKHHINDFVTDGKPRSYRVQQSQREQLGMIMFFETTTASCIKDGLDELLEELVEVENDREEVIIMKFKKTIYMRKGKLRIMVSLN